MLECVELRIELGWQAVEFRQVLAELRQLSLPLIEIDAQMSSS